MFHWLRTPVLTAWFASAVIESHKDASCSCKHSFLACKQTHSQGLGRRNDVNNQFRQTHTCTASPEMACLAWRQTEAEAEASHRLIYNIADTWQIPQHRVSMHKNAAPLPLTLSAAPAAVEHTYSSNSISRHTFFP